MKRSQIAQIILIGLIVTLLVGSIAYAQEDDTTLYQVSTLQALIVGAYDGEVTAGQLRSYGDTGLGTFDDLDGEMIVIDGVVYKARVDGTVSEVPDDETIPFANVAYISSDSTDSVVFSGGYDVLQQTLNELYPQENMPVLFQIEGTFNNIAYRSVPEQQEPYPPLTEVVENQTVFSQESIQGTLVGFRLPRYLDDMNAAGFHLHFISDDRSQGGHVLQIESGTVEVNAQTLDSLYVIFPDNLRDIDIAVDEDDVAAVEQE